MPIDYRKALERLRERRAGHAADAAAAPPRRCSAMGNPTGFHAISAASRSAIAPSASGSRTGTRSTCRWSTETLNRAGRPLHGLRHSLLPRRRLPGEEPHSRVQRPGLPRPLARGGREPALDQQLPRDHRPRLPRPLRGRLHAGHQRPAGDHQAHRVPDRRAGVRGGLGRAAAARAARAAGGWPSSAPGRPAWPPPSNWPAPATRWSLFEKDDRIGGLLRYGIPDFKLEKHVIDRRLEQMAAEGVKFEPGVAVGKDISGRAAARDVRRRLPDAWAPASRGRWPCPAPSWPASTSPWTSSPSRTAASPATPCPTAASRDPSRQGQARRRHRRRRHGQRLRRHVDPPGGRVGHATGNPAQAARRQQSRNALARLAEDHADLLLAGGRLPAPLEHADQGTRAAAAAASSRLRCCEVEWVRGAKGWEMRELPGTEFTLPADLVLLAMGFLHVVHARPGRGVGPASWTTAATWLVESLDDQPAGRFCRRRHGPRAPRWWSTPSTTAGSWPPPWTSGCGDKAEGGRRKGEGGRGKASPFSLREKGRG